MAEKLETMRSNMEPLRRDYYSPERVGLVSPPGRYVSELLGWKVKSVNGTWLRTHVDIDFTCGGNPARYAYCPLDELWVEEHYVGSVDWDATLLHEYVETEVMLRGLSYEDGHDVASFFEQRARGDGVLASGLTPDMASRYLSMALSYLDFSKWKL